jgi:hypothetical protein
MNAFHRDCVAERAFFVLRGGERETLIFSEKIWLLGGWNPRRAVSRRFARSRAIWKYYQAHPEGPYSYA